MKKIIQEVRVEIAIPDDADILEAGYEFLQANLKNAIDWEAGDSYLAEENPLQ